MTTLHKLKTPTPNKVSLTNFDNQKMFCTVEKRMETCYRIPLGMIEEEIHNPGRLNGTRAEGITKIYDDLITNPLGQEEPAAVKFNTSTGKFALIWGYTRLSSLLKARKNGISVVNSPDWGLWARVISPSAVEEIELQTRENGNKRPQNEATPDDIVYQLQRVIDASGLDGDIPFRSMSDIKQRDAAKKWLMKVTPQWGGRRFTGIWNKYQASGQAAATAFKAWRKEKMAIYYINNNKEGITRQLIQNQLAKDILESGDIIEVNGIKHCFYFSTQSNAYNSGATLTNMTRKKEKEKPDKIIAIHAVNGSNSSNILKKRASITQDAIFWNTTCSRQKIVDKIYWMPQTKKETSELLIAGQWSDIKNT